MKIWDMLRKRKKPVNKVEIRASVYLKQVFDRVQPCNRPGDVILIVKQEQKQNVVLQEKLSIIPNQTRKQS